METRQRWALGWLAAWVALGVWQSSRTTHPYRGAYDGDAIGSTTTVGFLGGVDRLVNYVVLEQLPVVYGKKVSGEVHLHPKDEPLHYMTQFGCDKGKCKYTARVRLLHISKFLGQFAELNEESANFTRRLQSERPIPVQLKIFLDEQWEDRNVMNLPACERIEHARTQETARISPQGNWSGKISGNLYQTVRPHVWYFNWSDCEQQIWQLLARISERPLDEFLKIVEKRQKVMTPLVLEWEVTITQGSGSHFSYEYIGTPYYNLLALAAFCALFALLLYKEINEFRKSGLGIHPMIQALNFALGCQIIAIAAHLVDLLIYSQSGEGNWLPSLFSDAFGVISQSTMAVLLIFVAMGTYLNTRQWLSRGVATPLVFLVVAIQLATVAVDKIVADSTRKFHSLEGWIGWLLCSMRLVLWFVFFFSASITRSQPTCPLGVQSFLTMRFLPAGSLYLLAYPLIFLVSLVWAAYLRHKFILIGTHLVQLVAMYWLAGLFILGRSEFFRISELSNSLLPGGLFSAGNRHKHRD